MLTSTRKLPNSAIEHGAAVAKPAGATWWVVSQVKSHRVVYFTDDPDYQSPTEGDWYYVSPYQGALPEGMTLRNCWSWRFNGMAFVDARETPKPKPAQALLEHNKQSLHQLLRDKINALRKPWMPSTKMGEVLRDRKREEANAFQAGAITVTALRWLPTLAAVRNCSVQEMAQRILDRHTQMESMLESSELLREELAAAIDAATSNEQLAPIRHRLMNELTPEADIAQAIKPSHTTPTQTAAKPSLAQLTQEQLRLQVLLRLKINQLRRTHVSDYLLDDVVLKHKGRLAQTVLQAEGDLQRLPAGLDATVLMSHAAARGITLKQAAIEVLHEMDETARVLLETEQMKDAMLARIASVDSFMSIDATGRLIQSLQLPARSATATSVVPSTLHDKAQTHEQ